MLWPRTLNLELGTCNYSFYRFFTSNFAAAGGNFPPSVVSFDSYGRLEHHHTDRVRRGAAVISDAVRAAARPRLHLSDIGRQRRAPEGRGARSLARRAPRRYFKLARLQRGRLAHLHTPRRDRGLGRQPTLLDALGAHSRPPR